MVVELFPQYSPEWWAARIGIPTASKFSSIISSTGKKSASWKPYAYKKAAEIETGKIEDTYTSHSMLRGLELEPLARKDYCFITGIDVEEVGTVYPDEKKLWSCSPDGISIKYKKGLEIKCPEFSAHKQCCYEKEIPTKYKPQVFGSLWICDEIDSWDFMCYHPDMKSFITTIDRDNEEYKAYVKVLADFLPEVSEFIKRAA